MSEVLAGWPTAPVAGLIIHVIPERCGLCSKPIPLVFAGITGKCRDCKESPPCWRDGVDAVWSMTVYLPKTDTFPATQLVRKAKDDMILARALGTAAAEAYRAANPWSDWTPSVVIPCPSHRSRRNPRSSLFAQGVADVVGLPYQDVLRRTDTNGPRSATAGKHMPANVEEMLREVTVACTAEFTGGENVLLVDDVMTLGTTAGSSGVELKNRGAASVRLLTFARTTNADALIWNAKRDEEEGL